MTQTPDDTATDVTVESGDDELSADDVADYLTQNPDFLAEHADILSVMTPPKRWSGDGIIDMQGFLMDRLRGEIDNLRACTQEVIETSRANMANQTRAHSASLALLGASNFEQMIRVINDDLPLILDVDVVTVGFEPASPPIPNLIADDILSLEQGAVDSLMTTGTEILLLPEVTDDGTLFGSGAGLVRSAAFARLRPSRTIPAGLMAIGDRGAGTFHPGQGTELIGYMARILERCLTRWLEPPD